MTETIDKPNGTRIPNRCAGAGCNKIIAADDDFCPQCDRIAMLRKENAKLKGIAAAVTDALGAANTAFIAASVFAALGWGLFIWKVLAR